MRSSKSRSRNNKNRNKSVANVVNRVFDSSGPEGKVRGTPQQIIEKYNQLARDAQLAGDRVASEAFQQHAEHYTRLLAAAQKELDARREQQEQQQRERQQQRAQQNTAAEEQSQTEAQPEPHSGLVETPEAQAAPSKPTDIADVDFLKNAEEPKAEAPRNKRKRTRTKAPAGDKTASEKSETTDTVD